jgi:hypothetical protein
LTTAFFVELVLALALAVGFALAFTVAFDVGLGVGDFVAAIAVGVSRVNVIRTARNLFNRVTI